MLTNESTNNNPPEKIKKSVDIVNTALKNDTIDGTCESSDDSSSDEEYKFTIPEFEPIGTWGTYGINEKVWCDKYRPVVKFKKYEDLILTDLEKTGYLTDRIIASCSSYLEKCPVINQLVLCKCVLNDKKLKNIEILKYHQFLQYLDLSWNYLDDVSELGYLSYLMYLDVSFNTLDKLLDFKPPHNLTYVNYSYNLISEIKDLSEFWSIKSLKLSHNHISVIEGLHTLKYLENLDLSFNEITILENLDYLNIVSLKLQNNQIDTCVCDRHLGFKSMPFLTYVRLGQNKLKSLNMLEGAAFLQSLEIQENNISDLFEISYLDNLNLLISVDFSGNPIIQLDNYKYVCLATMKKLRFLDGQSVEIAQKLHSGATLTNNITSKVHEDLTNLLTLSHLTKLPSFGLHVIPSDQPVRPIIMVVSTVGSRHKKLIRQFTSKNKEHVIRLINHTDREKRNDETDNDYYFVSKETFTKLLRDGELLMVYNELDNYYGLTQEEYDRCLNEPGKVLITHTDLTAALTFRMRGFRPILILAIPETEKIHRQWLMEDFASFVYHLRYPEAAVRIINTGNTLTDLTDNFSSASESQFKSSTQKEVASVQGEKNTDSQVLEIFQNTISRDLSQLNMESSSSTSNDTMLHESETNVYLPYSCGPVSYESYDDLDYQTSLDHSPVLMEMFYKKIIETREIYLEFHRLNPGIFYDTVYTNNAEQAWQKLKNAAKFAIKGFLNKHVENDLSDYYTHDIVQSRLKMYRIESQQSLIHSTICPTNKTD